MAMIQNDMPVRQAFHLPVDATHRLYVEDCGNPEGIPVIFLHGGPGGHIEPICRTFFAPEKYRVILFDQRGCGKSQPFLSVEENTPFSGVADIEAIRTHLNIDTWVVFGGSYGSSLALTYAILHPDRIRHMILRGVFLGRKSDEDWLYRGGAGAFYPEQYDYFRDFIPKETDVVDGYHAAMTGEDEERKEEAFRRWAKWEDSLVTLLPHFPDPKTLSDEERSIARLENHFFYHHMFYPSDNYLLENARTYAHIPMDIVQGRYDVICPPSGAYALAKASPRAKLHLVEAGGHSPYDTVMFEKLKEILATL